ncbi:MAG: hypothetical protein AAFN94_02670 [Pseudomonadota bacterium]
MRLCKALPLLPLTFVASPAFAERTCVLQQTCPEDRSCGDGELSLVWQPDNTSKIWVDGEELKATWKKAGEAGAEIRLSETTWTVVSTSDSVWASDGRMRVGISREGQSATVHATQMRARPGRFVEYAEVIADRRTFSGVCEGLF